MLKYLYNLMFIVGPATRIQPPNDPIKTVEVVM